MPLPTDLSPEDFDDSYRLAPGLWRGAVLELCAEHGLATSPFVTFTDGSNLLAAVGNTHVVKVFPPFHRHQWMSEHRALTQLSGKLSLPIPHLVAYGERSGGWTHTILSLLPGVSLERVWSGLSLAEQEQIVRHLGQVMREVHSLAVGPLWDLPPSWQPFLHEQLKDCVARHTRLRAPAWLLNELPAYLAKHQGLLSIERAPVILTGEYTPFNLLAESTTRGTTLTGMIDFGDTMVGAAEYDLLGPAAFLCGAKPRLFRALLEGYGIAPSELRAGLRTRLMLLMLLHRYSNLRVQLRVPDWDTEANSIDALASLLFPD